MVAKEGIDCMLKNKKSMFLGAFFTFMLFPLFSVVFAGITCSSTAGPGMCFSTDYGEEFYCLVYIQLVSNLATMVGLVVFATGVVTWLWKQSVMGIVVALVGVGLTAMPGIYEGFMGALSQAGPGVTADKRAEYYGSPACSPTRTDGGLPALATPPTATEPADDLPTS